MNTNSIMYNKFLKLSPEIQQHVLSFLPLPDLLSLATITNILRYNVQSEIHMRYIRLLSPYISNISSFNMALTTYNAIISGSAALYMIFPDSIPNDIDIYVTADNEDALVKHLVDNEGYVQSGGAYTSSDINEPNLYMYEEISGVDSMRILTKGDLKIDVITSTCRLSSTIPIFYFHSTIVMNVLTPESISILYPKLTFKRQGLIHDYSYENWMDHFHFGPRQLKQRAQQAIIKYIDRRYALTEYPNYTKNDHICPYINCRLTRTTDDNSILSIPIKDFEEPTYYPFKNEINWCIGGFPCGYNIHNSFYEPASCSINPEKIDNDD